MSKAEQDKASAWFSELQGKICTALEALEDEAPAALHGGGKAGRFEKTPWQRRDHGGAPGGGGTMAMLHGRLFEKAGVHVSTATAEIDVRTSKKGKPLVGPKRRKRLEANELAHCQFGRLPPLDDCLDNVGGEEGQRRGRRAARTRRSASSLR